MLIFVWTDGRTDKRTGRRKLYNPRHTLYAGGNYTPPPPPPPPPPDTDEKVISILTAARHRGDKSKISGPKTLLSKIFRATIRAPDKRGY